jgi:hypothetical protein
MDYTLPELYKIIDCAPQVTTAAVVWPVALKYVDLSNCQMCYIMASFQTGANPIVCTVEQATTRIGGSTKVLTVACPLWTNADEAATDTLVRQTAAVGFTAIASKYTVWVMQIDPATLDLANGFRYIIFKTALGAGGVAAHVVFFLEARFPQATPPAAWTAS